MIEPKPEVEYHCESAWPTYITNCANMTKRLMGGIISHCSLTRIFFKILSHKNLINSLDTFGLSLESVMLTSRLRNLDLRFSIQTFNHELFMILDVHPLMYAFYLFSRDTGGCFIVSPCGCWVVSTIIDTNPATVPWVPLRPCADPSQGIRELDVPNSAWTDLNWTHD